MLVTPAPHSGNVSCWPDSSSDSISSRNTHQRYFPASLHVLPGYHCVTVLVSRLKYRGFHVFIKIVIQTDRVERLLGA